MARKGKRWKEERRRQNRKYRRDEWERSMESSVLDMN